MKISLLGFTLVETLVYLGLISLLMSGALVSAYAVAESADRNRIVAQMHQEGTFLLRTISSSMHSETLFYTENDTLILEDSLGKHPLSDYQVKDFSVNRSGIPGSTTDPEHVVVSFILEMHFRSVHVRELFSKTSYIAVP